MHLYMIFRAVAPVIRLAGKTVSEITCNVQAG